MKDKMFMGLNLRKVESDINKWIKKKSIKVKTVSGGKYGRGLIAVVVQYEDEIKNV